MPEVRSPDTKEEIGFPSTTVIGSYPITVPESELEQFRSFPEETEDPVKSTIQLSVRDFVSAGIEYPSTGQTRESFVRLFLDPRHVDGIAYDGSEIVVMGKLSRKSPIRLPDVSEAKSQIPKYYGFKEPVTHPYTLARNCRLKGSTYGDLRELTFAIAREIVRPELESFQELVDYLQIDAPYFSVDPYKEYIHPLYEEMLAGIKKPVVLHVCGDTFSIFKELIKLPVAVISLDFTFSDKLMEEVSRRNFDQKIGLGCVNTGSPIVEPVKTVSRLIKRASQTIGIERLRFVHPACGERNLPLDVAYQKNINMTLARNDVFLGTPQSARSVNLSEEEYDPNGYFLIQVDPQGLQIVVSFNWYDNIPKFRVQSSSGEKLVAAIVDSKIISDTEAGKRHLGYVGYEIGKAETALKNRVPYRQDKPLSIPGML